MQQLLGIFRLVRVVNLAFIVMTQYFVRHFIILPTFEYYGVGNPALTEPQFALLVLATVFIAAAGYVINDYFDVNIDSVN